jgi:hypothetical protein
VTTDYDEIERRVRSRHGRDHNDAAPVTPFPDARASGRPGDARDGGRRRHEGYDYPKPEGTPVPFDYDEGEVVRVGTQPKRAGNFVVVRVGDEEHTYAHLQRQDVKPGQRIRRNDPLGLVGRTGNASGPHLHKHTRKVAGASRRAATPATSRPDYDAIEKRVRSRSVAPIDLPDPGPAPEMGAAGMRPLLSDLPEGVEQPVSDVNRRMREVHEAARFEPQQFDTGATGSKPIAPDGTVPGVAPARKAKSYRVVMRRVPVRRSATPTGRHIRVGDPDAALPGGEAPAEIFGAGQRTLKRPGGEPRFETKRFLVPIRKPPKPPSAPAGRHVRVEDPDAGRPGADMPAPVAVPGRERATTSGRGRQVAVLPGAPASEAGRLEQRYDAAPAEVTHEQAVNSIPAFVRFVTTAGASQWAPPVVDKLVALADEEAARTGQTRDKVIADAVGSGMLDNWLTGGERAELENARRASANALSQFVGGLTASPTPIIAPDPNAPMPEAVEAAGIAGQAGAAILPALVGGGLATRGLGRLGPIAAGAKSANPLIRRGTGALVGAGANAPVSALLGFRAQPQPGEEDTLATAIDRAGHGLVAGGVGGAVGGALSPARYFPGAEGALNVVGGGLASELSGQPYSYTQGAIDFATGEGVGIGIRPGARRSRPHYRTGGCGRAPDSTARARCRVALPAGPVRPHWRAAGDRSACHAGRGPRRRVRRRRDARLLARQPRRHGGRGGGGRCGTGRRVGGPGPAGRPAR